MLYMFLGDGFEETEALAALDLLRRAEIDVKTAGIGSRTIRGAHGISVLSDILAEDASRRDCDGIILPGGMPGTENLYASPHVLGFVRYCFENDKLTAAICAAPIIPGRLGLLNGKKAVCFPGFEIELRGASIADEVCVRDGNLITAKGAGAVFEFARAIICCIKDDRTASRVLDGIFCPVKF